MASTRPGSIRDGGHDAIRGFAFQFDATILEAFGNPAAVIGIEGDQDINRDDFYIQVKLRSCEFLLSRISKAVKQILKQFSCNTDRRYRLYCHFQDQAPGKLIQLTDEQLTQALGGDAASYDNETKKLFLDRFEIMFAADFQTQFSLVLAELRKRHSLRTEEEAIIHHAVLSQHLTSLVLSTPPGSRNTSAGQLDEAVEATERAIFHSGYEKHLGKQKYIGLLKSNLPGFRSPNIVKRARLVTVEAGPECHVQDAIELAEAIALRFHVHDNSPQPYVLFRGMVDSIDFKQELWDSGVLFMDGTNFDGDRFRIEDLTGTLPQRIRMRLVNESRLGELMATRKLQEVYEFFSTRPLLESFSGPRFYRMAVESVADAIKVMEMKSRR